MTNDFSTNDFSAPESINTEAINTDPINNGSFNTGSLNTEALNTAPTAGSNPEVTYSTKVRLGTITWGLILTAIGAGLMVLSTGYRFDIELAMISVLAFAGLTLVGGSLVKILRK